jgi:ubiquinone/menaquinone biosynthesis C-methylase UbiE
VDKQENVERALREREFHNQVFSDTSREATDKYYSVTRSSRAIYKDLIRDGCAGKRALEYGCGPGGAAFELAHMGAQVTAIDISDVAIAQALESASRQGLTTIDFRQMNAEKMEFPDASFDLVFGLGILHHLDLKEALAELSRTLRKDGKAVFLEPLGHNPLIRLYRWLTPQMRSADEHPLLMSDFALMRRYFGGVEMRPYHMSSLAAVPLRRTRGFEPALAVLEKLDTALFRVLPFVGRYAWMVLIVLSDPLAPESSGSPRS